MRQRNYNNMRSEIKKDKYVDNKINSHEFENMQQSSIIFITDAECKILSANEKFTNMAGYTLVDEVIGKTVEEVLDIKKSIIRSAIETNEHVLKTNEKRFKDDNNNFQNFLIYAIPIIDKQGILLGGIEIMIDMHNQVRQEELINLTAMNMPHHLKYVFINDGQNSNQNSHHSNFDFSQLSCMPDAEKVIDEGIRKLLKIKKNTKNLNTEYINHSLMHAYDKEELKNSDDTHIHAVISCAESTNGIDESTAVIEYVSEGYITEVTDISNLKKELQKREGEYWSLLKSIDSSIFILNRNCEYLFVNDYYLFNFKGLSKDDMIGKPYSEFHNEIQSRKMTDKVEEVFLTERTIQYEHQYELDAQHYLRTISPYMDEEEELTAVTVFSKDITELKKIKNELMQKTKSSESFAHMISHDFKAPLVTIRGFASMLREKLEGNNNDELMEYISYIEDNAKKMDNLMEDAIEYSQIEYVIYPDEQVPFKNIIDESVIQLKSLISSNNSIIRIDPELPIVCVDRRRMVEVITNIIENSIVHNDNLSDIVIDIGCRKEEDKTIFFIKDNGKGIDEKFHEKIFDMFYKLNPSLDGTGAGLAIVKKIIEFHEGAVWVESNPEMGECAICFTLFS